MSTFLLAQEGNVSALKDLVPSEVASPSNSDGSGVGRPARLLLIGIDRLRGSSRHTRRAAAPPPFQPSPV
jgi:hypothetical protein